ncbi:hypothetical protein C5S32_06115 [ANME-1 cluster archaeon GoMg1]|nr:hypothetical protein [ANME-1 cluster archaeon GoMg1]
MLELIYYGLFLLLYGFGAWTFFNDLNFSGYRHHVQNCLFLQFSGTV